MEEIKRMQKYLLLIRRALGWTADYFGEKIGVTRQTINNIEAGRNDLTKTQYIAMRSVIDAELARLISINENSEEAKMISMLLTVFVDKYDEYKEEDKQKILNDANMVLPSILAKTASQEAVSKQLLKTSKLILGVAAVAIPIIGPIISSSIWMSSLSKYSKKK